MSIDKQDIKNIETVLGEIFERHKDVSHHINWLDRIRAIVDHLEWKLRLEKNAKRTAGEKRDNFKERCHELTAALEQIKSASSPDWEVHRIATEALANYKGDV